MNKYFRFVEVTEEALHFCMVQGGDRNESCRLILPDYRPLRAWRHPIEKDLICLQYDEPIPERLLIEIDGIRPSVPVSFTNTGFATMLLREFKPVTQKGAVIRLFGGQFEDIMYF